MADGVTFGLVMRSASLVCVHFSVSPVPSKNAGALLEAWYPGEEGGEAIAQTLSGRNNPSGRLPLTFYASSNDLPAFGDYSVQHRTYRYYKGETLFHFGEGLSYTTFEYSKAKVSAAVIQADKPLRVDVDVKNSGQIDGDEVVELYGVPPQGGVAATQALQGFQRVTLAAGETQHLQFTLQPRSLSVVDAAGVRRVKAGTYRIVLGGGLPNASSQTVTVKIVGDQVLPE